MAGTDVACAPPSEASEGEVQFHINASTAIRGGDLPKIGPILLESPEFQSIQVHGWTLSRKLVEILQSV